MISSDDSITLPTSGSESEYSYRGDDSMEKDPIEIMLSSSTKDLVEEGRNDQNLRLASSSDRRMTDFRENDLVSLPEHSKSIAATIHRKNSYESFFRQEQSFSDNKEDSSNVLRNRKGNRASIIKSSLRPNHQTSKSRRAYYDSLERRAKNRSRLSRKGKENLNVSGIKQNIQNKSSTLRLAKPKTRIQISTKHPPKTEKPKNIAVFSRLYMRSQCKQEEGKRRREQIEKMRQERERSRNEVYHQPTKKISVAQASMLYYRGMEKKISLERRIAQSKEKRSTIPYKSHLLSNVKVSTARTF